MNVNEEIKREILSHVSSHKTVRNYTRKLEKELLQIRETQNQLSIQ